jgi:hypothetical protein
MRGRGYRNSYILCVLRASVVKIFCSTKGNQEEEE